MNRTGGTRLFGRMMVLRITGDVARAGRAARNAGVGCWISELGMRVGVGILLSEGVARAGSGLRSSCAGFPAEDTLWRAFEEGAKPRANSGTVRRIARRRVGRISGAISGGLAIRFWGVFLLEYFVSMPALSASPFGVISGWFERMFLPPGMAEFRTRIRAYICLTRRPPPPRLRPHRWIALKTCGSNKSSRRAT